MDKGVVQRATGAKVIAIQRDPFQLMRPNVWYFDEGLTLADVAGRIRGLPEGWPRHKHDMICINGTPIPRPFWGGVRPKPSRPGLPIEVTFHAPPMGGGGDSSGGKQVVSLVASLALLTVSGGIASGSLLGGLTGASAATGATTLSRLAAAGVMLLGSAALGALAPKPAQGINDPNKPSEPGTASGQGNVLARNAPVPRVVGTLRVFPPLASQPLVYYDGQDEIVEMTGVLSGPYALSDLRIGGVSVDEIDNVEYELIEGWPGETPITLFNKYGKTESVSSELVGHRVDPENGSRLDIPDNGTVEDALPQPRVVAIQNSPDEVWLDLNLPQGLWWTENDDLEWRIPLRLRLRESVDSGGGRDWIDLPELHYLGSQSNERRLQIRLVWNSGDLPLAYVSGRVGFVEARIQSPGQSFDPVTATWNADASFYKGSGQSWLDRDNVADTGVLGVIMDGNRAEIHIDESVSPKSNIDIEVEVKRGFTFKASSWSSSTYKIGSTVYDLFGYKAGGNPTIQQGRGKLSDRIFLVRANSIWRGQPVRGGHMAKVAIKGRNATLDPVSVLASGYVRDWDGSKWREWKTTSNPAPHLNDVYRGLLNAKPLPDSVVDDDDLTSFRTACTSAGHEINAILEDLTVKDAAFLIAAAGYATPRFSEKWGVTRDYDRSAEDPVQYFAPHNMRGFSWSKGYPDLPDGLRITFRDSARDYRVREIVHPPEAQLTEQVTYEGIVTEADARARAEYELATRQHRTAFYSWEAPALAIKCRKGSLVGVTTDFLLSWGGSGRVEDIEYDGSGDVAAVVIDNEPELFIGPAWADLTDANANDDARLFGAKAGVVLKRAGGSATTHELDATSAGNRLVLATAADPDGLDLSDLVITGALGSETRRLIVADMQPLQDDPMNWSITAIAEAPEIWS